MKAISTISILVLLLVFMMETTTALPIVLTQEEYDEVRGYKPENAFSQFVDDIVKNDPYLLYHFDNVTNISMLSHPEIPGYQPPEPDRVYKDPKSPFSTHQKVGLGVMCVVALFIIVGLMFGHLRIISAYRIELSFIKAECFINEYTRWDVIRRKFLGIGFITICVMGILLIGPYIVLTILIAPVLLTLCVFQGRYKAAISLCKILRGMGLDLKKREIKRFAEWASGKRKKVMEDEEQLELDDLKKSRVITRKQIEDYPISRLSPFNNPHDYLIPREGFINSKTYKRVINNGDQKVKTESCAICIEEFEDNSKMYILPCQHYFHASCLAQERKINMREPLRCPLCQLNLLRYYVYYKEHKLNPKYNKFDNSKILETADTSDDN